MVPRRVVCIAAIALMAGAAHAANNFGFWTVGVLRNIDHQRGWPSQGQYSAVVVHNGAAMRLSDLRASDLDIREQIDAASGGDPYVTLRRLYRRRTFHCVIVSNLSAPQLAAVEQFARDFKVIIVATTREVRSAPFAILPERDAVYGRSQAYASYGFKLKPMPRVPVVLLDRDPLSPAAEPLVRCRPVRGDIDLKDWRAEEICYGNAQAKQKRAAFEEAIFDLSVAVILRSKEAFHHPRFEKGWGFASYHPNRDLAVLLARFGNCDAAASALRRSILPDRQFLENCPTRTTLLEESGPERIAGAGAEIAEGQAELLPPFAPPIRWSALVTE